MKEIEFKRGYLATPTGVQSITYFEVVFLESLEPLAQIKTFFTIDEDKDEVPYLYDNSIGKIFNLKSKDRALDYSKLLRSNKIKSYRNTIGKYTSLLKEIEDS